MLQFCVHKFLFTYLLIYFSWVNKQTIILLKLDFRKFNWLKIVKVNFKKKFCIEKKKYSRLYIIPLNFMIYTKIPYSIINFDTLFIYPNIYLHYFYTSSIYKLSRTKRKKNVNKENLPIYFTFFYTSHIYMNITILHIKPTNEPYANNM